MSVGLPRAAERLVVLGCGWGGFRLARVLDKRLFDVKVGDGGEIRAE
jgi:hypothetical protein